MVNTVLLLFLGLLFAGNNKKQASFYKQQKTSAPIKR
jgi:hypothetical protein